ncbi:M48 family metallopeptidase [Nostoc sp. UIC10630]|nr:M48 family metallopeptidase [Nostoc sp. UIC 10630]
MYACKLGVYTPGVKLSQEKRTWGTCGKDGVIHINWQLVDAPLSVLEYVVAYEIVHLLHRNYGNGFWEALSCVMPG